jgi:hypothetical protein
MVSWQEETVHVHTAKIKKNIPITGILYKSSDISKIKSSLELSVLLLHLCRKCVLTRLLNFSWTNELAISGWPETKLRVEDYNVKT